MENDVVLKIGWWFVISCIGNSFWIIAWLYEYPGFSVILMLVVFFSFKNHYKYQDGIGFSPTKKYVFIFWPFAIYSGWITVALIADIAAWLTKLNWDGFGISQITWTIIMIVVAGVINVLMVWKRNLREFALVGIWALIAISVANKNEAQSIVYTCYIMAAIILVSIVISGSKNRKSSLNNM